LSVSLGASSCRTGPSDDGEALCCNSNIGSGRIKEPRKCNANFFSLFSYEQKNKTEAHREEPDSGPGNGSTEQKSANEKNGPCNAHHGFNQNNAKNSSVFAHYRVGKRRRAICATVDLPYPSGEYRRVRDSREVRLSRKDRKMLEGCFRSSMTLQRDLKRARIVLLTADGCSTRSTAKEVRVHPRIVSLSRRGRSISNCSGFIWPGPKACTGSEPTPLPICAGHSHEHPVGRAIVKAVQFVEYLNWVKQPFHEC
jgi:hypothetical protein